MDAKTLFRQGIAALRDEKDMEKGRTLLTQSLRLDPQNDVAWLWLSRTVTDADKRRQCIERALQINPENEQARALMTKLQSATATFPTVAVAAPVPENHTPPRKTKEFSALSGNRQRQIDEHLQQAEALIAANKTEEAIEQWVRVLDLQPDHQVALPNAIKHLAKMNYLDDCHELVMKAVNSGTDHPSVYLTAIDIAKRTHHDGEADDLRLKLAGLPQIDEKHIVKVIDYFTTNGQYHLAAQALDAALVNYPKNQMLLLRRAEVAKEQLNTQEAVQYFERAAQLGTSSKEGKKADEQLSVYLPQLTDKERGSVWMALREAVGFGSVYLLMGWQDAGLDLLRLGPGRIAGVLLSVLGGYLLVTAASSPQQQPIATWLGGSVPEKPKRDDVDFEATLAEPELATAIPMIPVAARVLLGVVGAVLLILAFRMVFGTALGLISNPNPIEFYIPTLDDLLSR